MPWQADINAGPGPPRPSLPAGDVSDTGHITQLNIVGWQRTRSEPFDL